MEDQNNVSEEELVLKEQAQIEVDYSSLSKEELLVQLKSLKSKDMSSVQNELSAIRSAYNEIFNTEKHAALERFIADDGKADDFEYRLDETSVAFEELNKELKAQLKDYYNQRKELEVSVNKKKSAIVEELREIVNSSEVTNNSFNKVKELQQSWKDAHDQVSYTDSETWKSYRGLLDIYYNNRSISYELKDLDRKKNQAAKVALCERAEALANEADIRKALSELSACHKEYKVVGPVPEEIRESLWERFKAATEVIHQKRDEFEKEFAVQKKANAETKTGILEKLQAVIDSNIDKISDWNNNTKTIKSIQDEWEKAGPVEREIGKELSKEFWAKIKEFYRLKGAFFDQLDTERDGNMKLKEALCEKVEALKDEENFKDTADKIKKLQAEWKEVGPVPQKHSDAIYKRFRSACDYFFDRRKSFFNEKDKEYVDNLKEKRKLIKSISSLKEGQTEELVQLIEEFNAIGFVPRDDKKTISDEFREVTSAFLEKVPEGNEKDELEITVELGSLKGHPDASRLIGKRRDKIRGQISELNDDISTLNTNIEFFARSKNADSLRAEVDEKVKVAEGKIKELKRKLQLINNFQF